MFNDHFLLTKETIENIDYLILHSTSGPINRVLNTLSNKSDNKSCHYVIDENGEIHQLLKVSKEETQMGWHAGRSLLKLPDGKIKSEFNNFSIGIELINKNGNLYPYTDKVYEALIDLVKHLITLFPALQDSNRILGHEHISGFRGKVDPGHQFDWERFFKGCYGPVPLPERKPQMPMQFKNLLTDIQGIADQQGIEQEKTDEFIKRLMQFHLEEQKDSISPLLDF